MTVDAGEVKFQEKIPSRLDYALLDSFIHVKALILA
jgi:hypothetical protein